MSSQEAALPHRCLLSNMLAHPKHLGEKLLAPASLCLLAFVLGIVNPAASQDNNVGQDNNTHTLFNPTPVRFMRELSADRPDKTDCPFTVDAGHFQVEMDFLNLTSQSANAVNENIKYEGYQIVPMTLKVGLSNSVDFQLVLSPLLRQRTEAKGSGRSEDNSGFGDVTPRIKVNLVGNDRGFFALALIPFVKFPTAQNPLGNGAVEGGLGIPYSLDIPDWDVGFQTTFHINKNDGAQGYHSELDNSVSIGHTLLGHLSLAAEFFTNFSTEQGSPWVGTVDTWLTFQCNENMRLDGGAYLGVTPAADNLHLWLGTTFRI